MTDEEGKLTRLNPQLAVSTLEPQKRVGLVVVLTGYGKAKPPPPLAWSSAPAATA